MTNRPNFNEIKSYEEFEQYYFYRNELQEICKNLGLEHNANKIELNNIIKEYFKGNKIKPSKKIKIETKENNLTLNSSLIECGFTFGNKFRQFYINETGENNFKFTADMVATVKEVKRKKDYNFTLGDLLDIKLGKKEYAKYNNSSCQWNKFVKDFCADKNNNIYSNKLKVASKFWALLRDSNLPKVYSKSFIDQNKDKI